MESCITLGEIVGIADNLFSCNFTGISNKKIMFEAKKNGKTVCMCSPRSKYHKEKGCYWVDVTSIQYKLLDQYDVGFFVFRLEGKRLMVVTWENLKPFLKPDYLICNSHEGDHWKLFIFEDGIRIGKRDNFFPCDIMCFHS